MSEGNKHVKRNKIIYWIFTLWVSLGLVSTGIVQVLKQQTEVEMFTRLGYPAYLLVLLGAWKLLAVIALLIPRYPLIKEWAYAGIFFTMTGAEYSHIASGSAMKEIIPPLLMLALAALSWYFRPADRKIASGNPS